MNAYDKLKKQSNNKKENETFYAFCNNVILKLESKIKETCTPADIAIRGQISWLEK